MTIFSLLRCRLKRTDLIEFLGQNKIGARLLFAGNLTKKPCMVGRNCRVSGDVTNTEIVMNHTLWINTVPGLDDPRLNHIINKVERFFGLGF